MENFQIYLYLLRNNYQYLLLIFRYFEGHWDVPAEKLILEMIKPYPKATFLGKNLL